MLTDFGFTHVATTSLEMLVEKNTTSFMAPELLLPTKFGLDKEMPSKEADIYALGMTVYQVLTGERPFFSKREPEVIHAVISGERPPKPENADIIGMTKAVWDLLEVCWREDRATRPNIAHVLETFYDLVDEGRTESMLVQCE